MTEEIDVKKILRSILEKRFTSLIPDQKIELSSIIFDYIQLLNDSKIEEAANYLLKAREKLARII